MFDTWKMYPVYLLCLQGSVHKLVPLSCKIANRANQQSYIAVSLLLDAW